MISIELFVYKTHCVQRQRWRLANYSADFESFAEVWVQTKNSAKVCNCSDPINLLRSSKITIQVDKFNLAFSSGEFPPN